MISDLKSRFENVPAGEPFSVRGALSADYSLQFVIGWNNYKVWLGKQPKPKPKHKAAEADPLSKVVLTLPGRRVTFRAHNEEEAKSDEITEILDRIVFEQEPLRAGPELSWE